VSAPVVLLYHDVLPPGGAPPPDTDGIRADALADHVEALRAVGAGFVPLAEAFALAEAAPPPARRSGGKGLRVAVTFDDGYAGVFEHLPPLVSTLSPTLFLTTEHLGLTNLAWNTRAPVVRGHLSLAQVRALGALGVALEAHGTDHHNLLKFGEEELRRRHRECVGWFEANLGRRPSYFAYPYGACDATVERITAEHFAGAVSVNHGRWAGADARRALNRISVPSYLSGAELVEVVLAPPAERWVLIERFAPWRRGP
jgi:peptidoglycan/xylan/chitin deacetylase (PgdA/CDA1 family)